MTTPRLSRPRTIAGAFGPGPSLPTGLNPSDVRREFGEILHQAWFSNVAYLERREGRVYGARIAEHLSKLRHGDLAYAERTCKSSGFESAVKELFRRWYPDLVEIISNMVPPKPFEHLLGGLLSLAGFHFDADEHQHSVNYVLPGTKAFARNKTQGVIAAATRNLERWLDVVEQLDNARAPNVYVVTADANVDETRVESICDLHNIHLVVWDQIKKEKFPDRQLAIGYSEWVNDHLVPLSQFWIGDLTQSLPSRQPSAN